MWGFVVEVHLVNSFPLLFLITNTAPANGCFVFASIFVMETFTSSKNVLDLITEDDTCDMSEVHPDSVTLQEIMDFYFNQ